MPYELPIIYSFDYTNFSNPELESKAQKTLSNFIGFVRTIFDSLLENGKLIHLSYNTILLLVLLWKVFVYS